MSQGDQARYRIGDQMFNDLPALLNFYKVNIMSNVNQIEYSLQNNDLFSRKFLLTFLFT